MEAVEDSLRADGLRQMVPVEVGPQLGRYTRERQLDAAGDEVLLKLQHHACGGVVHIRDRFGIDDQPSHRRRRGLDQPSNLV